MTRKEMHTTLLLHGWRQFGATYAKDDGAPRPLYYSFYYAKVARSAHPLNASGWREEEIFDTPTLRAIYNAIMKFEREGAAI